MLREFASPADSEHGKVKGSDPRQVQYMDHRLICTWLGLPSAAWPPDHYTLLGLPPGEADVARIEQQAHERLARIRCYQLSHPEQATEAMNRLAQAMVCLTDPASKKQYDVSLGLSVNGSATAAAAVPAQNNGAAVLAPDLNDTAINAVQTRLDWASTPPPVRAPEVSQAATETESLPPAPAPPPAVLSPPPAAKPADPFLEAARKSRVARRGLGTRRALYERLLATRALLRAWDHAGRFVARPSRQLLKTGEGTELARRLTKLDRLLLDFPPLIGQAGQPGYRVVILAREHQVGSAFRALGPDERAALALDWKSGRDVLQAHRRYLGDVVRCQRRQGRWKRLLRPARVWVKDHPAWVAALIGAALGLAALSLATGL
jgi:hypothetical protein